MKTAGTAFSVVSGCDKKSARASVSRSSAPIVKIPCLYAHCVRRELRGEPTYWVAGGSRMTDRPLLRVRATRFRASASSDAAMKEVNLAERKSEAEPPIPIAFTVLEMVQ